MKAGRQPVSRFLMGVKVLLPGHWCTKQFQAASLKAKLSHGVLRPSAHCPHMTLFYSCSTWLSPENIGPSIEEPLGSFGKLAHSTTRLWSNLANIYQGLICARFYP